MDYSLCTLNSVRPIHVSPPQPLNDVILMPLIVAQLKDERDKMLNKQVNTVEINVFTQEFYFDTLQEINKEYDVYDDGSNIITFGLHTFSMNDLTVSYVDPS